MRSLALTLVGCLASCIALAEAFSDLQAQLQAQVVKVNAERTHGTTSIGSAVNVGGGKLITNCHVVRWAKRIQLTQGESRWATQLAAEDAEHDLCVLAADGLPEPVTDVLGASTAKIGQEVFAAGYPGGREFNVSCGKVKALHEHDSARVIRTSAPFSPGASGGGLFDAEGRLLGVLTFRAVSGGDFHFVMPVEWVKQLLASAAAGVKNSDGRAFWERSFKDQPYFLQAAAYEEGRNWNGLLRLAKKWILAQSWQPESWMAVGKACSGLGRLDDAALAFRNVLTIDPSHSEGQQHWDALAQKGQPAAATCAPNSWCDLPLQNAPAGLAVVDPLP